MSKEVELEDRFENMGAKLVNEVASKTSDNAGDGTTTGHGVGACYFQGRHPQHCGWQQSGSDPARDWEKP